MELKLLNKEEFDALPANLQRVEIAKDVIMRMESNLLTGRQGNLLTSGIIDFYDSIGDPQDFFNSPDNRCSACAKGALICSWVGNFNSTSWRSVHSYSYKVESGFPDELISIFGYEMLDQIEVEFEGKKHAWNHTPKAVGCDYSGNLYAIMENIIENNGEFIP